MIAPISLRNFNGPELLGKKLLASKDSYYEHALIMYGQKYRPCAVKFNFTKDGIPKSAFFVSPVARCKFVLDSSGNVKQENLVVHSSADGQFYRGVLAVRAKVSSEKASNIERFYGKRGGGKGTWIKAVDQEDQKAQYETVLLQSQMLMFHDIAKESIPEIRSLYLTQANN